MCKYTFLIVVLGHWVLSKCQSISDYPLLEPDEAGQTSSSTSGSGSGSGDLLLPQPTSTMQTIPPGVLEYGTMYYITLTFQNLTQKLYHDHGIEDILEELLIELLMLDAEPLILLEGNTVLVYFPIQQSSLANLHMYVQLLMSTNNTEWQRLAEAYDLSSVKAVEVTGSVMPWWQWLIIALTGLMALMAYCLLIIACCCRCWGKVKKRNPRKVSDRQMEMHGRPSDHQESKKWLARVSRVNYQPKSSQIYSRPLSIVDLEQVVANPSSLIMEFTAVPFNMATIAEVPVGTEDKNRYKDVLPNPQTRVALFLKFGVANSDYINANYIRGYQSSSKSYIATQGPLHWTVADFWRMVWEQKVGTIIMITKLEERGMAKCVQYWPEESHSIIYEDLQVRLQRRIITKDYSTTTLLLQHREKMMCREVTHFWFTGWPDHGVPITVHPLLDFLLHIRKRTASDMLGPTLIHCSAGIGRSGVVIAAYIAMQQWDEEGEADLLRILSLLRQDRGGMIQTKEQYIFLHQVILEYAKRDSRRFIDVQGRTAKECEPVNNDTTSLL